MTRYKDEDLIGKRFGRLVVEYIFHKENGDRFCHCICDCGKNKDASVGHLNDGHCTSCGCARFKFSKDELHLKRILKGMKRRCSDPKCHHSEYYLQKGIKVCDEWMNNPMSFIKWSLENGWKKGLTIDRIDPDKDYSPDNCRWVNYHVQSANASMQINNKSGYIGVYYDGFSWVSIINVNKIQYYIGSFNSKREAVEARNKFIIKNGLTEYKIQEWKGD